MLGLARGLIQNGVSPSGQLSALDLAADKRGRNWHVRKTPKHQELYINTSSFALQLSCNHVIFYNRNYTYSELPSGPFPSQKSE